MYTIEDLKTAVKVILNDQQYDPVKSRSMKTKIVVRKWDPLILKDGQKVFDNSKQIPEETFVEMLNQEGAKVEIFYSS